MAVASGYTRQRAGMVQNSSRFCTLKGISGIDLRDDYVYVTTNNGSLLVIKALAAGSADLTWLE
jgi:hypothetical protein